MPNTNNQNKAILPKRMKFKDNPYELGFCLDSNTYTITFEDGLGVRQTCVIDYALYQVFNQFELDDVKTLNKIKRHSSNVELSEEIINTGETRNPYEVTEVVERRMDNERLRSMIMKLPQLQRSRIIRYYFENLTYAQIAKQDGCSLQTVARTIQAAENNLKKFYKKG